jgi:hypothetical protein
LGGYVFYSLREATGGRGKPGKADAPGAEGSTSS